MGLEQPRMRRRHGLDLTTHQQAFAYQLQAVEAAKDRPYAAIFHEQGLGKTKIGIDLALEWLRVDAVDAVMIVTKLSLIQNWAEEIAAHSHLRPKVLSQDHSANFYGFNSAAPLFLAHYEVMRSEERRLAMFLRTRRVAVVLDESQKIKNPDAELSKSLHRLAPAFHRRVIMSGTPVANRPYDLWSQIFFLDQGKALGTDFEAFKEGLDLTNDLWKSPSAQEKFAVELGSLHARIADFAIRETKRSAGIELPEKRVENVVVELEEKQRLLYDTIRTELEATVQSDGVMVVDDAESALKRLLRLVQVASNPRLVDQSYDRTPGKLSKLLQLVGDAVGGGSKVIVWTSFVDNATWLADRLAEHHAVVVHGGLEIDERQESIRAFKQDDQVSVLVATPGAAKEGLTLTVANHAVFYDRSFSLDDYLQAQDRIHRISQKQTCFVWNLVAKDTIDEWVEALLTAKRLAAQLAQADMNVQDYVSAANYDFGKMVVEILGGAVDDE
ncbi:DEAD/DEAH box helicase [Mesorhizobium sp. M0092]|uniref:DEAD/DEAH box helicase n=1 Tax=Mesorhizobium sp. M0092 TaxID=2956876 RepID=UPI00333C7F5E